MAIHIKIGQWCLFWNKGKDHFMVARLKERTVSGLFRTHGGDSYTFCAPIGDQLEKQLGVKSGIVIN